METESTAETESKAMNEEPETEDTKESENEINSEPTEESGSQKETETEELDPENRTYSTYPLFVTEFTLEDGVLTVKTEDAGLVNYPIPEEMEFSFSYPLAEDCKWIHPYVLDEENKSDIDFMYSLLSFELEGAVFELSQYKDGKASYESDEAICKFSGVWSFTVVEGKVVEFLLTVAE